MVSLRAFVYSVYMVVHVHNIIVAGVISQNGTEQNGMEALDAHLYCVT